MVVLNFNTSHVTVYRFLCSRNVIVGSNFNTSHVTVYHLEQHWSALFHCYFNTSHVTVYRTLSKRYSLHRSNFNTSHVTVYLHRIHTKKCLLCNFNTSHVTVYHYSVEICQAGRKISIHPMLRFILNCDILINSSFSFQYIPCYGLSTLARILSKRENDFNTSHVTVYRNTMYTAAVNVNHFNTSHVTVYLMILSHFYLGIFHHFLYFTSFQHFLPADYKI